MWTESKRGVKKIKVSWVDCLDVRWRQIALFTSPILPSSYLTKLWGDDYWIIIYDDDVHHRGERGKKR